MLIPGEFRQELVRQRPKYLQDSAKVAGRLRREESVEAHTIPRQIVKEEEEEEAVFPDNQEAALSSDGVVDVVLPVLHYY